jgi:hypothetical protein
MKPFVKINNKTKSNKDNNVLVSHISKVFNLPVEKVLEEMERDKNKETWINDQYKVVVRKQFTTDNLGKFTIIHLSINRVDNKPIHSWRDFQCIKNLLVGEENYGVEVFPNESDLVDTANQYHLWVFEDPTIRLPFGFKNGRCVSDNVPVGLGMSQNPFKSN